MAKYTSGSSLRDIVAGGDVVLVRGSWLWEQVQQGAGQAVLPRRQELPGSAILGPAQVDELFEGSGTLKMDIVVVSYCWLTKAHPDPRGVQLRYYLGTAIQHHLVKNHHGRFVEFAVFLDWCSLHQKPRTAAEKLVFDRSLATINVWYAHRMTRKWLLTAFPSGVRPDSGLDYGQRGWTTFELTVATMITPSNMLVDCGRLPPLVDRRCYENRPALLPNGLDLDLPVSETTEATSSSSGGPRNYRNRRRVSRQRSDSEMLRVLRGQLAATPCWVRSVPVTSPTEFREQVRGKTFTCGLEDMELVCRIYEELFKDLRDSEELDYSGVALDAELAEPFFRNLAGFGSLQQLKLRGCFVGELPDTIGMLGTAALDLSGNPHMVGLSEGFGRQQALQSANFCHCRSLAALPETFGQLGALQSVDFHHCESLAALPETFGQLGALQSANFCNCKSLAVLPETFGQLGALQSVDFSSCKSLAALPATFGQLGALQSVNFDHCESLAALPATFGQLGALQSANFDHCESLAALPETFGQLGTLQSANFFGCRSLAALPETFGQLGALQSASFCDCKSLAALPETFGQLGALQSANFRNCKSLAALPETFGQLGALQSANFRNCESLAVLPETFGQLGALQSVDFQDCKSLAALPETFGQLGALQRANFYCCPARGSAPLRFR